MAEYKEYYYSRKQKAIYERLDIEHFVSYPRDPQCSCFPECDGRWESGYGVDEDESNEEHEKMSAACKAENMDEFSCPYEQPDGDVFGDLNFLLDDHPMEGGHGGVYPLYIGWFKSLADCRRHMSKHKL